MHKISSGRWQGNREAAGFLASLAFACLAWVRDVRADSVLGYRAVLFSASALTVVVGASLILIALPIYVNQVGIALASPLTVHAVLAVGPVLIFLLQLIEGRLSPCPYSLASAVLYGVFAVSVALARRRAIRSASLDLMPLEDREARAPETRE